MGRGVLPAIIQALEKGDVGTKRKLNNTRRCKFSLCQKPAWWPWAISCHRQFPESDQSPRPCSGALLQMVFLEILSWIQHSCVLLKRGPPERKRTMPVTVLFENFKSFPSKREESYPLETSRPEYLMLYSNIFLYIGHHLLPHQLFLYHGCSLLSFMVQQRSCSNTDSVRGVLKEGESYKHSESKSLGVQRMLDS